MTTIIGIFDNARDLDKAVDRLARAGFEDTVFDENIVAEEAGRAEPIVFALGHTPASVWGGAEQTSRSKPNRNNVIRAFKAHLSDYNLPDNIIEGYAITLHHSEFLLVKTETERADQVVSILRESRAVRVDRHG